jgi:Flp pilus assembly protein TadG
VKNNTLSTLSSRIRRDQSGEGVISTAIAVLIMAFIGAAMWIAFNNVFTSASETIESEVGNIGNSGS